MGDRGDLDTVFENDVESETLLLMEGFPSVIPDELCSVEESGSGRLVSPISKHAAIKV